MELFITLIVIAFLVAVFSIPIALARARETDRVWTEVATQLGLRFAPRALFTGRRMEGTLRGYKVAVYTFTRRHGKSSSTYTRFQVHFPRSLHLGLQLTREGFFSGLAKKFGVQDIEVGDAAFDPDVMVKGTDPRRVIGYLTRARRVRIHRFLTSYENATIRDSGVMWERRGVLRQPRSFVSALTAMTQLAWHLTGERSEDLRMERALVERIAGRPTEALAILEEDATSVENKGEPEGESEPGSDRAAAEIVEPAVEAEAAPEPIELETRPVEERFLEAELLHLAGREDEARTRFEEALEAAPEDPEIREWAERLSEREREPARERREAAPGEGRHGASGEVTGEAAREVIAERGESDPETAAASSSLDVASVCEALFAPASSSYQSNRLFESRYRGRQIRWTGVLREAESFAYDVVFGSDGGTRAVIEVFETETGFLGESRVHAVVQLPADLAEELEERKDREITVVGRLAKVDVVMRNIYVNDGAVLDKPA